MATVDKPIERGIRDKLTTLLQPSVLTITNDSWQHRHHAHKAVHVGESHFSVMVVSEKFVGKSTMQRHRMIYAVLAEELKNGLHALSLKARTQAEDLAAEAQTPQGTH